MSGIEVAGLVLGAIPLIVEGFKIYANGVSTVGRYRKYKRSLEDLWRGLKCEYVTYQNTCEQLLDGLVDDAVQKADLLDNPGGDAWKDPDLEEQLKERLGRSYESYVQIMSDMKATVKEIQELLKLGPDGKVQLDPGASKFREEYHRLKFSIKQKDYDSLVSRITRNNEKLAKLTEQNRSLESSRCSTIGRRIPDFKAIQKYASQLYNLLSSGLRCSCPVTHSMNLKLDGRSQRNGSRNKHHPSKPPGFQIVVSYSSNPPLPDQAPWTFEALDVRPVAEAPHEDVKTTLKKAKKSVKFAVQTEISVASTINTVFTYRNQLTIRNLCQTIPRIQSTSVGDCIGVLEDELAKHKMVVFQPTSFVNRSRSPSLISLHTIISRNRVGDQPFSWADKLRVAVVLASSLLQLHHTPWLSEEWGKKDISFMEGADADGGMFNRLFVSKTCEEGTQTFAAADPANSMVGIRNKPLFALGILLIELCEGRPFEELRKEHGGAGEPSAWTDFTVAGKSIDKCYGERGMRYGDVVRRCVWCPFDTRRTDLEDAEFCQAVYDGVVAPLEEDLASFEGLDGRIQD